MNPTESGYRPCAVPECMEIAIGQAGAICQDCEESAEDAFRDLQATRWPDCHKCGDELGPGAHICGHDRHDETIRGRIL